MRKLLILLLAAATAVFAADLKGKVTYAGLPVPGVAVSAGQVQTVTDLQGNYVLTGLPDGPQKIEIEIAGFEKQSADAAVDAKTWELVMLPIAGMHATLVKPGTTSAAAAQPRTELKAAPGTPPKPDAKKDANATQQAAIEAADPELSKRAQDGLLINGSQNNGASSPFSQSGAFGNNRGRRRSPG